MATQDNMQDVFPVNFDFVKGEQPSGTKLTGGIKQTDTAFSKMTKAIGDPWDYNTHSGTAPYTLSPAKLAQTSIARFAGPSDYASPRGASFQEGITHAVSLYLDGNRNQWCAGYPLVKLTSPLNLSDSGSGKVVDMVWGVDILDLFSHPEFGSIKSDRADVQEAGDFHIDYKAGVITTYSVVAADFYLVIHTMNMFGPGTPWGTSNVIPHWQQTTSLCYVTIVSSAGGLTVYNIEFPEVEAAVRDTVGASLYGATEGSDIEPYARWNVNISGESAYYRMPYQLVSNLSAGDSIPEGSISIYEESQGRIVAITDIRYQDEHNIRCECPTGWLTAGNTVRIIVTGSSLAEDVHYLMSALRESRHGGLSAGQKQDTLQYSVPLSHSSLTDCYAGSLDLSVWTDEPEQFYFRESSFPTNPHPQYLHRSGYQESDLEGNHANAMKGHIVFAGIYPDYNLGNTGEDYGNKSSTYGILWGGHDTVGDDSNTRLNFEGGHADDSWGVLDSPAIRYGFSLAGVGAATSGLDTNLGALAYTPWHGTPLYLRGHNDSGDGDGAILGFDLGQESETNYIKLMPAVRAGTSDTEVANMPAHNLQSDFADELGITPSLTNRLSASQIREFRFRGVSRNEQARNAHESIGASNTGLDQEESFDVVRKYTYAVLLDDIEPTLFRIGDNITLSGFATTADNVEVEITNVEYLPGPYTRVSVDKVLTDENPAPVGAQVTLDTNEFNQYFVSPGMVGCDFLNLYSNAIFFSDTGDGKRTSFTSLGTNWMKEDGDAPSGIYFYPNAAVGDPPSGPYVAFSIYDTTATASSSSPFKAGDRYGLSYISTRGGNIRLSTNDGNFGIWTGVNAITRGLGYFDDDESSIIAHNKLNIETDSANLVMATVGSGDLFIQSVNDLYIGADKLYIRPAGDLFIESTGGKLYLEADNKLYLKAGDTIRVEAPMVSLTDFSITAGDNIKLSTSPVLAGNTGYIILDCFVSGLPTGTPPNGAIAVRDSGGGHGYLYMWISGMRTTIASW